MAIFPNPDVPVLVETPSRPYLQMVRCHYLSVECNDPRPEWQINLGGQPMPFLMLGPVGIIQQPFDAPRFTTYGLIDQLFAGIEARADLLINFNDIWLPGFLFKDDPGNRVREGWVHRCGFQFLRCLRSCYADEWARTTCH